MYIKKNCENFIYQNDDNGEFAIGLCTLMTNPEQDHEGNYGAYKCPLGKCKKNCYIVESLGSDRI
jgi:hypothetical protein